MPTTGNRVGAQAWTVLELTLGGRVFRFTSSPEALMITDFTNTANVYEPGLTDIPAKFGPSQGGSVPAHITAPPGNDDTWAELVARGFLLDRAPVTVRRWWAGRLEEGETLIDGKASNPKWGGFNEPVSFTVARHRREAGVIPPSSQVIDPSTWPVTPGFITDPAAIGATYPWVFGRVTTGMLPAYLVEYDAGDPSNCRLHFAGHYIEALEVEVFENGVSIGTATVLPKQDLLNVWCSTVIFLTLTAAPALDREYRVALNQGGGGWAVGAGEIAPWAAADILEELLRGGHGDFDIDWPRFSGVRERLNAYLLGVPVVSQTETWAIVQAILGILPVDWIQGPNGAYPKRRVMSGGDELLAGSVDCTRVTGRFDRMGRLESAGPTVYNFFAIRYGLSGGQQRPKDVLFLGSALDFGGEMVLTDARLTPSRACQVSEDIYRLRPKPAIVTELVHDAETAGLILADQAEHHALPRAVLVIQGDITLDRYESDDVIDVVAIDIDMAGSPAAIRGKVSRDDGTTTLQAMVLEPLALSRLAP